MVSNKLADQDYLCLCLILFEMYFQLCGSTLLDFQFNTEAWQLETVMKKALKNLHKGRVTFFTFVLPVGANVLKYNSDLVC